MLKGTSAIAEETESAVYSLPHPHILPDDQAQAPVSLSIGPSLPHIDMHIHHCICIEI